MYLLLFPTLLYFINLEQIAGARGAESETRRKKEEQIAKTSNLKCSSLIIFHHHSKVMPVAIDWF
jgi:hypothetical protein